MIAASNRLPRRTMKPAFGFSGRSQGRMTALVLDHRIATIFANAAAR